MIRINPIFSLIVALLWVNTIKAYQLPDLGERSATYISPKKEKGLGEEFMKMVRKNLSLLPDEIINNYIKDLGKKLAANTNTPKKYKFFVVDKDDINAFAGPDGHIGINTGTITSVATEDELAAIMAHEIAHISQHHIERLIKKAKNTQMAATLGMLTSLIIGSTTNNRSIGNLAQGGALASMGGAIQHMITFTRENEIEADNIGIKILYQANFDPQAMPNVFERIQRLSFSYLTKTPKFLLTHPVTSDRIAEAKNRANQYKFKKSKTKNIFTLIKIRTRVITSRNLPKLIKNLQIELKSKKRKNALALKYGYALALYRNLQFTKATQIALELQKEYPNELLPQMLIAKIEKTNKQSLKALSRLKNLAGKHRYYYPLIIQYAKTLITTKHAKEARDFIRNKMKHYRKNANLYELLAQAYAKNNQKVDAYLAKAKACEIRGQNHEALALLQQALKIFKLSANNKAIINAKIKQIKKRGNL